MSGMDFAFLPDQGFDCMRCGECCRGGWGVGVEEGCRKRLEGSALLARLEEGGPVLITAGLGHRAAEREGHCAFLDERGLCSIQVEYGEGAKPQGCTRFPFLLLQTPEALLVGVSFCCPAVQLNHGRPLAEWKEWLIEQAGPCPRVGFRPLQAGAGKTLEWSDYLRLEEELHRDVLESDPARALFRRLQGFCRGLKGSPLVGSGDLDPGLLVLRPYSLAALIGTVEALTPEEAPALSRALLFGEEVHLHHFGWRGDPQFLLARLDQPGPPELEHETTRYLQALLFRKWPATERPVLYNLFLLALIPWLVRLYAWAVADARKAPAPEACDAHRALSWVDRRLLTHSSGLEPLLASLAQGMLHQVEACPVAPARPELPPRWRLSRVAAAAVVLLAFLGGFFGPSFLRPDAASVALVVAEPAGHGDDPSLLQALQAHHGTATILLEVQDLENARLVENLARSGEEVGALVHPGTSDSALESLRMELDQSRHIQLQAVYSEVPETGNNLEQKGYRVLRQEPLHLKDSAGVTRLAQTVSEGSVVFVEGGRAAELLVGELARRGLRVTPLSQHATHSTLVPWG
jgi:Fe-S-cluster containining protein